MRRAWLWNQILPAQKLVQIGSADAAERRFDLSSMFQKQLPALFCTTSKSYKDLTFAGRWFLNVFDTDVAFTMEDYGFHCDLLVLV